jgi:hypothetical protein
MPSEEKPHLTNATSFFKHEAGESFGIFYPTDYLVAFFPSHDIAEDARKKLMASGYRGDQVMVMSGPEFEALYERAQEDASAWSKLTSKISRIIGSEELYLDVDRKHAESGAGFLAAYCPSQEEGQRILHLLKPLEPLSMRRYTSLAVDRII